MFPQKQERRRIQISHSQLLLLLSPQPQPQLFPERILVPFPQPPKHDSNRIIQIRLQLFPKVLLQLLLQPQFVADKSLIIRASRFYLCFIVCMLACQCFLLKKYFFGEYETQSVAKDLNKFQDIVK